MNPTFGGLRRCVRDAAGLTVSERTLLVALRDHLAEQGYAPSFAELAPAIGSTNSAAVAWHMRRLEARGLVERVQRRARTLRLTQAGAEALAVTP